jgi:putative methionine-R-sulfoxide reductase with GAF domain
MEDVGMQKADLLDELRMEIGVASDRTEGECAELYQAVCDLMVEKMGTYEEVCIYLSGEDCFVRTYQCGAFVFPFQVPFGEGICSLAAVRGSVVWERVEDRAEVAVPFYRGHHLRGVLTVAGKPGADIDDGDVTLFCELASLFESKVRREIKE